MKDLIVLGVIPARSGSKGVTDKNTRPFAGKSLLQLAIETAIASRLLTETIVSTDSERIAEHALNCGAKVPFLRPRELAADNIPIWKVLEHALDFHEDKGDSHPDLIATLQPTSPFRKAKHIDTAIEMIMASEADALLSISEAAHTPYKMRVIRNGFIEMFIGDSKVLQRQEAPIVYVLNGIVYITKREVIRDEKSLWSGKTIPYVLPASIGINIDTMEEFEYAEWLFKRRAIGKKNEDYIYGK